MDDNYSIKNWDKFLVRYLGLVILRKPSVDWPDTDSTKDYIMAFHYCREQKEYRFDRHYDLLSRAEHFCCGGCEVVTTTPSGYGIFAFKIQEIIRISSGSKSILRYLLFFKLLFFGFGKYMPENREGRTSGELEREASIFLFGILSNYINLLGKIGK